MGSALLMHLITTYPAIILLIVAVTKGEGIEALAESAIYIPALFIITYGITLMLVVYGRVSKYEIDPAQGITLHVSMCCCCPRRQLDMIPNPVVDVNRWDDCSRLWYGQPDPPIEVSYEDHCCWGKSTYYLFPEAADRQQMIHALNQRRDNLTAGENRTLLPAPGQ